MTDFSNPSEFPITQIYMRLATKDDTIDAEAEREWKLVRNITDEDFARLTGRTATEKADVELTLVDESAGSNLTAEA